MHSISVTLMFGLKSYIINTVHKEKRIHKFTRIPHTVVTIIFNDAYFIYSIGIRNYSDIFAEKYPRMQAV